MEHRRTRFPSAERPRAFTLACLAVVAGGCVDTVGQVSAGVLMVGTSGGVGEPHETTTGTSSGGPETPDRDDGTSQPDDDAADMRSDLGGSGTTATEEEPTPPPPPNYGDCCMPSDGIGCVDAVIAACVCSVDPHCCEGGWDELCVDHVSMLGCGACELMPAGFLPDDACCEAHDEGGCNDATIVECVCAIDPFCCLVAWDEVCVATIEDEACGSCEVGTTGEPEDADDGGSSSGDGSSSSGPG